MRFNRGRSPRAARRARRTAAAAGCGTAVSPTGPRPRGLRCSGPAGRARSRSTFRMACVSSPGGRPWAPPASWKAGSRRQARRMLPTKPTICCVSGSPKSTTTPIGSRRRSIPVGLQKQSPPSPTEDPFTAAGSPALQQCCSREDLQLAATRATDSPGNERNDRSSGAALALQVLDRRPHLFSVPRRPVVAGRQPRHPGVPTRGDQPHREALRTELLAQRQETLRYGD